MDLPFDIFKVDESDAGKIASSRYEPHAHEYEELLIGIEGEIEHFIDFKSTRFTSPFVSFVTKGKLHRLTPFLKDGKFSVWALTFRSEFIPETTFQLYSYYHDHANFMMQRGRCLDRLVTLCEMMFEETRQPVPD